MQCRITRAHVKNSLILMDKGSMFLKDRVKEGIIIIIILKTVIYIIPKSWPAVLKTISREQLPLLQLNSFRINNLRIKSSLDDGMMTFIPSSTWVDAHHNRLVLEAVER